MDFGYPQYTEAKILSEFIKTDAYKMEVNQRPPMAVTNAVSWRSEGIRYKKNEVRGVFVFDTRKRRRGCVCVFDTRLHSGIFSQFFWDF